MITPPLNINGINNSNTINDSISNIDCLLIAYCIAAVGPGAARRGAWGARTVRATAAAVGPGAVRGAWGGHGLGEKRGGY